MNIRNVNLREVSDIRSAMCLIGPEQAKELLRANTRNRKASPVVIRHYADDMGRGEWFPTGSGIGFDDSGVLLDGQQRLMAIVESEQTVPILVTIHLPQMSQEKIDRPKRRTLFDAFSMFEKVSCRDAVQIATFLARNANRLNPSDTEVRDMLRVHKDALEQIAPLGIVKRRGLTRVGVLAALTLAWERYGEEAKAFFVELCQEAHADRTCPALRMRSFLWEFRMKVGGWEAQLEVFERTCYAFNAYHAHKRISAVYRDKEIK